MWTSPRSLPLGDEPVATARGSVDRGRAGRYRSLYSPRRCARFGLALLVPQRLDRLDAGGAPGGQEAGEQRDAREQERRGEIGHRVRGRDAEQVKAVERASREMMQACVDAGGSITGEHGVGLDKREYMGLIFGEREMQVMCDVRRAFNPDSLANPAKILPVRVCREWAGPATRRVDA